MSKIAVVIPCFNLGRMLEETLQSVLAQTRPAAEIVIVDDGSTDILTRELLCALEAPRTRIVHTPNRGLPSARNTGIGHTAAQYVVTLDGDDQLEASYLEETASFLDGHSNVAFVSTSIRAFDGAGYEWTPPPCTIRDALTRGVAHPASMFRRVLWESIGGFDESTDIHGCEDVDFWLRAMVAGFNGAVIPRPLFRYRVRPDSMHQTNVADGRHVLAMRSLLQKHEGTVRALGTGILLDKERFYLEQRSYVADLEARKEAATKEIDELARRIGEQRSERPGRRVIDWGDLSKSAPVSPVWGTDRGLPIDRLYIGRFLERWRNDVRGRVLEVKDSNYTRTLAESGSVLVDVIDVDRRNPDATLIADLTDPSQVPDAQFDCFIMTQTLHMIFDLRQALTQSARLLKPGGVLLCTIPAVSRVDIEHGRDDGDYWRMTSAAVRRLFAEVFPVGAVTIETYGNVKTASAFLYGLAAEDLDEADVAYDDPNFPLIHCVRAVKPSVSFLAAVDRSAARSAILLYHRVASRAVDPFRLCVAPEAFRSHLAYLKVHCTPISLRELIAALRAGECPPRAVAITFDDGYVDNSTTAVPILDEFGLRATFFVNSAQIECSGEFWWDRLARIMLSGLSQPEPLSVPDLAVPIALRSDAERRETLRLVHAYIRCWTDARRQSLLQRLEDLVGTGGPPRADDQVMDIEALRTLAEHHDVGAHSVSHPCLPILVEEDQRYELEGCKMRLEEILARPIESVAYPYGDATPQTAAIARAAGFSIGLIVGNQAIAGSWDPLLLPRYEVREQDFPGQIERLLTSPDPTRSPPR